MKNIQKIIIGSIGIIVVLFFINQQQESPTVSVQEEMDTSPYIIDDSDFYQVDPIATTTVTSALTEREETWLKHMREEEKLARDVYQTLGTMWDIRIFNNIAESEQTHTDAVQTLLARYRIPDPVTNDTVGVFTAPEIQTLYDQLVQQGSRSLMDALVVGITIEDLDIYDLEQAMSETQYEDINVVYMNLQKGSRNHMRAFMKQISNRNGTYTPQYISQDTFEAITSATQERGKMK